MEKQEKVLRNIHKEVKATTLGVKKNDECYTSMQDILNELSYWADLGKFKGKNIICPCDWDIVEGENIYSITITYKEADVEVVGNNISRAVSVQYDLWSDDEPAVITKIDLKEDEIEDFLRNKLTCNFVRTLTQNARAWGIKSITASGYNPATDKGVKFQDVDYSKYDICITNPPFSLYGEFMKCIVDHIDFIILAPFLNRANPNVGLPLMLRKAYLGTGVRIGINFANPTIENKFNVKAVACDWVVSWPEAQEERNKNINKSGIDYNLYKDEYKVMIGMTMKDGTHPIKVPGCQVPDNYDGWMFSDISVISRLSHDEYEWYVTQCHKYLNSGKNYSPFQHKVSNSMYIDSSGKKWFSGIIFRKKRV